MLDLQCRDLDPKPEKPKNIHYSTYTPYYTCFHVVPICCQLNAIGACRRWSGTPKPSHIRSASLPASADSWLQSLLICNRTAAVWPPASQQDDKVSTIAGCISQNCQPISSRLCSPCQTLQPRLDDTCSANQRPYGRGHSECLTMHALALRRPNLNPSRRKEAMMAVINQTAEQ